MNCSAQNKIVVLADLPDSSVPDIGIIPSHHLFPIIGKIESEPEFYLHSDGSLFQIYRMNDFSIKTAESMIENMPDDSALQFYRVKRDENRFYFCLRVGMDYSHIDLRGKKFFNLLFGSYNTYGEMNERITKERKTCGKKVIPDDVYRAGLDENDVYEFLCDYKVENGFPCTKYHVKSNISAILTGDSKHSCVLSINNLDAIPWSNGLLKEHDFLQIVTVVKSSKRQRIEVDQSIGLNKEILNSIQPSEVKKRGVSVDTMQLDASSIVGEILSGVFFINVSFCLTERSLTDLKKRFSDFEETLYNQGIVLYCHSNSARAQYISLFPGNSIYGEHWNKAYIKHSLILLSKVMGL